jgi:hypothetical protein
MAWYFGIVIQNFFGIEQYNKKPIIPTLCMGTIQSQWEMIVYGAVGVVTVLLAVI